MKLRVFLLTLFIGSVSQAALIDLSAFYFSDNFGNNGTTKSYGRTMYDLCIATQLTKGTFIGWNYLSTSAVDNPGGAPETVAGTQMGLKFFYFFGRSQMWRLGLAYNLVASGSYSTSGAIWKGTGLFADFGAAIPVSDSGSFVLRLNYSSTSYVDEYIGVAYTQVTNTRVYIYPSVGYQWDF